MSRIRSSLALLVGCVWALGLGGTAALAADMAMPVKAPPPPPPPPSNWYGFIEFDWESNLVNPNGMALSGNSETVVAGIGLNLWNDKTGFINNWKVGVTTAADFTNQFQGYWTPYTAVLVPGCCNGQSSVNGNAFDWAFILESSVTFGQYWTLSESFINVYSLDVANVGGFSAFGFPSGFPALVENDLKLSLNDSFTGWPITFNPYVTFAYYLPSIGEGAGLAAPGTVSAIGFEGATNAYNFFVGAVPTFNAQKYWGIPLILKAPTYVTVGPSSTWNALCGNAAGAGLIAAGTGISGAAAASLECSSGSVGIFTTGLTALYNMTFLPANYGHWYVKAGFQYYDFVNSAVQAANVLSVGAGGCLLVSGPCSNAYGKSVPNDIIVGFAGIGVAF